jgi:cytochrome bd-type quinol oxidase subunit 2
MKKRRQKVLSMFLVLAATAMLLGAVGLELRNYRTIRRRHTALEARFAAGMTSVLTILATAAFFVTIHMSRFPWMAVGNLLPIVLSVAGLSLARTVRRNES